MPVAFLLLEPRVELGDDRALLLDAIGREAARDRQRDRVVGQDLVGVSPPAGGLGHDLDGVDAVGPLRMGVQVPAQVAELDEVRQPARQCRLDLALVLAQLGLDVREVEEGVGLLLGRERAQLGRVAGQRLAVLVDAQVALLGQAPAAIAGTGAQLDVVLLRAREMDAGTCRPRRAA